MESVRTKAKRTVHKHHTPVDKVLHHGGTDYKFRNHYMCILERND